MCRAAIDISLLWSERRDNLRRGIHRRGEVSSPDGLGQPTPGYGVRIALLRGDWVSRCYTTYRSSGAKGGTICGAASIVGARLPRPMGWGTQPLRVQRCATIPHCAPLECGDWMCRAAIDISLLWSERRHNLRRGIHRRGEVTSPSGLGNPTPTDSIVR